MLTSRIRRASAIGALALLGLPGAAVAMPLYDNGIPSDTPPRETTVVREVPATDGGQTLALIMSGAALVVAAGAAIRTVSLRPATAGPAGRTSPRPGAQPGR
jgi:hypothetical protein